MAAADSLFVLREAESEEHLFTKVFFDKEHSDLILLSARCLQLELCLRRQKLQPVSFS